MDGRINFKLGGNFHHEVRIDPKAVAQSFDGWLKGF